MNPNVPGLRTSRLGLWLLPLLWAALIFCVSCIPHVPEGPSVGGRRFPWDKFAHAAVYAVLGGLLFRAFVRAEGFRPVPAALLAVFFGGLFALRDETHQFFMGRDAEMGDLVADWAGLLLVTSALAWRGRRRQNRPSPSPSG